MEEFKSRRERAKEKQAAIKGEPLKVIEKNNHPTAVPKCAVWYKNKKIIIAIVVVVVFILSLLAFWLLRNSSDEVQDAIEQSRQQVQSKTNALSEGDDKMANLVQLIDALSPVSCRVGFMPVMGEAGERCRAYNNSMEMYKKDVVGLQQLLEYDDYMKKTLSDVNTSDEVADYGAEQERLVEIKVMLDEAPHREAVGKPHDDIAESISAIAEHWGRLSGESSEENEEGYNEAEKKLAAAYAALQKNASDLMHVYDTSQRLAYESYKQLIE